MIKLVPKHQGYIVATILFVLAFSLRLYAVNNTVVDKPLRADAGEYYSYALNVTKYGVYSRTRSAVKKPVPDAVRAPGYPIFLMPFVGDSYNKNSIWQITFAQALIDSVMVLLALGIFRHFISEPWAVGAAFLVAISPHLVSATTYVLSETVFTFLMVLSIWLLSKASQKTNNILMIAGGMAMAMAALTRPSLQYFIIPVVGLMMFHYGWKASLKGSLLFVAGFSIIFSLWIARNIASVGIVSDNTLTKNTLYHGMYPDFTYKNIKESRGFPYRYDPRSEEITQNISTVLKEISRRFNEEPGRYFKWYLIGKPASLFYWNTVAGPGDVLIYPVKATPYASNFLFSASHFLMKKIHWLLVILALLASIAVWIPAISKRLSRESMFISRLLSLLIFYFIAVHMVGAPFPRYSIPLRPVIYGLAMFFCSQYYNYFMELRSRESANNNEQ